MVILFVSLHVLATVISLVDPFMKEYELLSVVSNEIQKLDSFYYYHALEGTSKPYNNTLCRKHF